MKTHWMPIPVFFRPRGGERIPDSELEFRTLYMPAVPQVGDEFTLAGVRGTVRTVRWIEGSADGEFQGMTPAVFVECVEAMGVRL